MYIRVCVQVCVCSQNHFTIFFGMFLRVHPPEPTCTFIAVTSLSLRYFAACSLLTRIFKFFYLFIFFASFGFVGVVCSLYSIFARLIFQCLFRSLHRHLTMSSIFTVFTTAHISVHSALCSYFTIGSIG